MQPWRSDPYLWVHLAGLATVPLWIDLCLLGLAVGNPALPGLELAVITVLDGLAGAGHAAPAALLHF
jgi:hypothetical protein